MQQEPGVWVEGPDGELIPDYESTFPEINEGQVVHGTVVRVDKDEVLVDIGYKSEGVIPVSELSIRRSPSTSASATTGPKRSRSAHRPAKTRLSATRLVPGTETKCAQTRAGTVTIRSGYGRGAPAGRLPGYVSGAPRSRPRR
jgi:hypothetical protein